MKNPSTESARPSPIVRATRRRSARPSAPLPDAEPLAGAASSTVTSGAFANRCLRQAFQLWPRLVRFVGLPDHESLHRRSLVPRTDPRNGTRHCRRPAAPPFGGAHSADAFVVPPCLARSDQPISLVVERSGLQVHVGNRDHANAKADARPAYRLDSSSCSFERRDRVAAYVTEGAHRSGQRASVAAIESLRCRQKRTVLRNSRTMLSNPAGSWSGAS